MTQREKYQQRWKTLPTDLKEELRWKWLYIKFQNWEGCSALSSAYRAAEEVQLRELFGAKQLECSRCWAEKTLKKMLFVPSTYIEKFINEKFEDKKEK